MSEYSADESDGNSRKNSLRNYSEDSDADPDLSSIGTRIAVSSTSVGIDQTFTSSSDYGSKNSLTHPQVQAANSNSDSPPAGVEHRPRSNSGSSPRERQTSTSPAKKIGTWRFGRKHATVSNE